MQLKNARDSAVAKLRNLCYNGGKLIGGKQNV